jgi:hypothetical protein
MRKKERETLKAGARMIDDVELDRLWRLALQGEIHHAVAKLSGGGPKHIELVHEGGTPWRKGSEWLFNRKSFS